MLGFLVVLGFVLGWIVAHIQKGIKIEVVRKGQDLDTPEEGNPSYGSPEYMRWLDANYMKSGDA